MRAIPSDATRTRNDETALASVSILESLSSPRSSRSKSWAPNPARDRCSHQRAMFTSPPANLRPVEDGSVVLPADAPTRCYPLSWLANLGLTKQLRVQTLLKMSSHLMDKIWHVTVVFRGCMRTRQLETKIATMCTE